MALIASVLQRAYSAITQLDEVSTSHCTVIYHLFLPQCLGQWFLFYAIYCLNMSHMQSGDCVIPTDAAWASVCVCVWNDLEWCELKESLYSNNLNGMSHKNIV